MRAATTQALIDRYDGLRAAVDRALTAGPGDASALVAPLIAAEARLLDARAFDVWLALYAADACLWIPAHPADHPGRDQALAFDDRRRLAERARHLTDPQAWAVASPHPMTTRIMGPVEAWADPDGILATCTLHVRHVRRGPAQTLTGRQVLVLTADGAQIRAKALLFPDLSQFNPAVGWLM